MGVGGFAGGIGGWLDGTLYASHHSHTSFFSHQAGVRQLEREVAAVCRSVAMQVASARGQAARSSQEQAQQQASEEGGEDEEGEDDEVEQGMVAVVQGQQAQQEQQAQAVAAAESFAQVVVTPEQLEEILGPVRYESEIAARLSVPGVVTGLAWKVRDGGEGAGVCVGRVGWAEGVA